MEKITAGHPLSQSEDILKQNIDTLKLLFPTIVKEGKIDIGELKALLGEDVEENEEYFRFTWAGKSHARQEANKPSTGTLRPDRKNSKDWDTTRNIFIEGDNLEVLKLLQKGYANTVKMIYIDPPYNTGKDFVYKDNYADNLTNYFALTNQTDETGKKIGTNSESDGRYHSNWLNMIYPRLKLARNLLDEEGTIFISIDDNEVQNLRKVCDEIFGEDNFVANIIWQKKYSPQNDAKWFSNMHDHIICYAKNKDIWRPNLLERTEEQNARYSNPDNDPRGNWKSSDFSVKTYSKDYDYPVTTPSGRIVNPPSSRCWRTSKTNFEKMLIENRIWFGPNGDNVPSVKKFLTEVKQGVTPSTIWFRTEVGDNQEAAKEIRDLFETPPFDTPKPTRLISKMIGLGSGDNDLILDFFAGSGSTAQAVMQLNALNGMNRRYICVQLPEPTELDSEAYKAGLQKISEITMERIRRAGEVIKNQSPDNLFTENDGPVDIGFKAFKLDNSNINAWDGNVENFEQNLFNSANNIKDGRTEEDVLYEILIKSGLDLSQEITQREITGKKVYSIGLGTLFICLSDNISTSIAEGIGQWKAELEPATCKVIFKDSGFTDVEKTNSIQILKRFGINEVNSI